MKQIFVIPLFLLIQNAEVFGDSSPGNFPSGGFCDCPANFPSEITCGVTDFENWSEDFTYKCLYTAWPTTEEQVLTLANWALENQYTMRASGMMHGYSPLTVEFEGNAQQQSLFCYLPFLCKCKPPKILLVKTLQLTEMKIISNEPGNSSFWAQPGIMLGTVLKKLEDSNLGILHNPSIGSITLGGALTVATHGTAVPTKDPNSKLAPGHSYGSISNLIMEVTVVAYDNATSKFVLKTIPRTDPAMQGILVNLGRTFVTNYTLRAGPLLNISCRCDFSIPASELFAHPDDTSANKTISHYLDTTGRIETLLFPFTEKPWTKIWEIAPTQPVGSREVKTTNNYPLVDNFPKFVSDVLRILSNVPFLPTRLVAKISGEFEYVLSELGTVGSTYIWGTSRTVLVYANNLLRWTTDGHTLLTSRGNVQLVLNTVYEIYKRIISMYPIFGPFQVRVIGVDNPADVLIPGAQVPGMGPASPSEEYPDFDTVIWVNFQTYTRTETYIKFMVAMEGELIATFKPPLAVLRAEWSKGWAYSPTANHPASNEDVIKNTLLPNQRDFTAAKNALNNLDPYEVITDPVLRVIFG